MPKPTKGPRLGGGPAHERLLLANLAAALFTHKSITTTETKAKRLRPLAERLVTFAKRGDLHARRRVLSVIGDKEVVHVLFTEIAPLVADREGGYTRITKVGNRKGDNAPMAVIELVLEPVNPKPKAPRRRRRPLRLPLPSRRPRPTRPRSSRPTRRRMTPPPTSPPRPKRPDARSVPARPACPSGPAGLAACGGGIRSCVSCARSPSVREPTRPRRECGVTSRTRGDLAPWRAARPAG